MTAKRNIKTGEEITVNYNKTESHQFKIKCNCSSLNCKVYFYIQKVSSILLLGDSYTKGTGVKVNESYPYLISTELGNISMEVLAKNGWSSNDLLNNLNKIKKKNYDLVFLLIGVNDFCDDMLNQAIMKNINLIYRSIKSLSKRVFILTIPDFTKAPNAIKYGDLETNQKNITDLNLRIQSEFSKKCEVIDIFSLTKPWTQKDYYTKDGIHPSEKQYKLWVDLILKEL